MEQTHPINRLALWLGPAQRRVMLNLARGEEEAFFLEVAERLAETIARMPRTYEQSWCGEETIAYLHYFTPGADFYITEKDRGSDADQPEDFQTQAFGLVRMGGAWELGYICLPEILRAGAELDLYFAATALAVIKAERP
jgi:hypothetical protein